MTLQELLDQIKEFEAEYPEEMSIEIRVQDEDGIYESPVTTTDIANGLWIIVETQPPEEYYATDTSRWFTRLYARLGRKLSLL